MDEVLVDLAAEHADLARRLEGLEAEDWGRPTRCPGWDVADVLVHLAQSDELALARLGRPVPGPAGGNWPPGDSVDEVAAAMVEAERTPGPEAAARWTRAADTLVTVLAETDPSARVPWIMGALSARSLATTRLAEAWIHGGDVAQALGQAQVPSRRLRSIARLAWRTLPYAFARAGRELRGPVTFSLEAPDGGIWDYAPPEPALTRVSGPAHDLCLVAARRREPQATALVAEGPDGADVLALVRTYA